jgi:hypothetical protein
MRKHLSATHPLAPSQEIVHDSSVAVSRIKKDHVAERARWMPYSDADLRRLGLAEPKIEARV